MDIVSVLDIVGKYSDKPLVITILTIYMIYALIIVPIRKSLSGIGKNLDRLVETTITLERRVIRQARIDRKGLDAVIAIKESLEVLAGRFTRPLGDPDSRRDETG